MPLENLEEEGLAKNPNLELAQLKFLARTSPQPDVKKKCLEQLMAAVEKGNMAPFYSDLCQELELQVTRPTNIHLISYIMQPY